MKLIYFFAILILLAGCAPGPPPPPISPGFGWFIIGLIIVLAILFFVNLWKKYSDKKPQKTNYLTEALNAINQRLKELEQKIDELEKRRNKDK